MIFFKLSLFLTIALSSLTQLALANTLKPNEDLPNQIATKNTIGKDCEIDPTLPPQRTEVGAKHMPYLGTCTYENNEVCSFTQKIFLRPIFIQDPQNPQGPLIRINLFKDKGKCDCGYRNETKNNQHGHNIYPLSKSPDNICLGPPGFPCKTFPIGAKNQQKTCLSGICDLVTDMCTTANGIFQTNETDSANSIHSLLGLPELCGIFLVQLFVVMFLIKLH